MKIIFVLLSILALLTGCGGSRVSVPIDDRTQAETTTSKNTQNTAADVVENIEPNTEQTQSADPVEPVEQQQAQPEPVVLAMIEQAEQHMGQGDIDQALASLERAARIKPKDPWLWHTMAVLQMENGQYAEAITLAEKSIALASSYRPLLAANWQVILDASKELGDQTGIDEAKKQLRIYQPNAIS